MRFHPFVGRLGQLGGVAQPLLRPARPMQQLDVVVGLAQPIVRLLLGLFHILDSDLVLPSSRGAERRCGLPPTQQLHQVLVAPSAHRGVEPLYSVVAFLTESQGDLGFQRPAYMLRRQIGNEVGQSSVEYLPVAYLPEQLGVPRQFIVQLVSRGGVDHVPKHPQRTA
jgi:hypothetical protein